MKDTGDSEGKTQHVSLNGVVNIEGGGAPNQTKKRAREEVDELVPSAELPDSVPEGNIQYKMSINDEVYTNSDVGYGISVDGDILLRCAIGVVSQRDGVHANDPVSGKSALTAFKLLEYRASDDTSLIECKPLTGR